MSSRPRVIGQQDGGRDLGGNGAGYRVQDILAQCPTSMGSGLLVDDKESSVRLRVRAIARIKELLEQVKANIKVCTCTQRQGVTWKWWLLHSASWA